MKLRRRIPAEIASEAGLGRNERALAWATDVEGRHIVATQQALVLQRNPPTYERIGWESIERASYAEGVLAVALVPDTNGTVARLRIPIGDALDLPVVVRDRVTASIVINQHMALQGRKGVRVVARRAADGSALRWGYVFDAGLVADDHLRAQAEQVLEQVRQESGLD